MDVLFGMSSGHAAALNIGLLIVLMLALKLYVGGQRGKLKLASGETNAEFNRATRVQLNAVEDVPLLMVGILALAMLATEAWYIHAVGLTLLASRIAHAVGLAGSGGFSWGRAIGTLGTMIVYLAIAGGLIYRAFAS